MLDIVPVPSVVGGLVLVSLNCTLPVAVDGDTVAVNVTDWPKVVEAAVLELRTVEVDTRFTACPPPVPKAVKNPIGVTIEPANRIQTSEIPNIFFND